MVPSEVKLLDLLSNNDVTFFIPPYQRNYEWDEEQCRIFWEDIVKTAEANLTGGRTEHFFGSITFFTDNHIFGEPDKLILIDGQQRITTTMLFLAAVRDSITDDKQRYFIEGRYLKNNNVTSDTEYKVKLKQVESDWAAYKKVILGEELGDNEKDSCVYRNYSYFRNRLLRYSNEETERINLVQYGLNNFRIIKVQLQPDQNPWENPQEIFESMNSIGKPLSLADLARNYLLLGLDADTQDRLYKSYWLKMEKTIPKQISVFIRDYMQGYMAKQYKQATETNYKELYSQFKLVFSNANPEELLKNLAEYSGLYACIALDNATTGDPSIDRALRDIRNISATTAYSLLLMMLATWRSNQITSSELVEILNVLKIYLYRRRLVALSQGENRVLPTLASEVQRIVSASDKAQVMFEILSNLEYALRLPNDDEVKRVLPEVNFYAFKYAKYYLALLEEYLTKSLPDLSAPELQIEHIMPQNLSGSWESALGPNYKEVHQKWVNNIGNLTLIRHNQELGNKSFKEKKEVYKNNAGLQIAKTKIVSCNEWTEETIKARAGWMTDYLLNGILPIPESMRKANNYAIKASRKFSFEALRLVGSDIAFVDDQSIVAHVVGEREVEFEGKRWRLSPLTREIYTRKGIVNKLGSYQGPLYWEYDGTRLTELSEQ